jgi:hypothetical protein
MSDIINFFKMSPDYDPNLSWDTIIKKWEENFLGSNQHDENFSYSLEHDYSFDNWNDLDKQNQYRKSAVLQFLFDSTLNSEHFTCVNSSRMEMYNMDKKNDSNSFGNENSWTIMRSSDCVSKPFLRFNLKKNLTNQDISNLLYLLSDCKFEFIQGGVAILTIPKLLFIFLVCEKLSQEIKIFNVKKFLQLNTMKEIKDKIVKLTDNSSIINQKYYVSNQDDIYLDIPLLMDLFLYNISTPLIALSYCDTSYKLTVPPNKVEMIKKYLDFDEKNCRITLMFEEIIYFNFDYRRKLAGNSMEFVIMQSSMDYFHSWTPANNPPLYSNVIKSREEIIGAKFIFVIVRQQENAFFNNEIQNKFDSDIDISELPRITKIEFENLKGKHNEISMENIWVGQFSNIVVYGIAADGISNMNGWIKVMSEGVKSIEKLNTSSDSKSNFGLLNNLNMNNYEEIYKIVNLNHIQITWSESVVPVNIEMIYIEQNAQRFMSGMSGVYYAK